MTTRTKLNRCLPVTFSAILLLCQGCVTGLIEKPDLTKLAYNNKGVLKYGDKAVEIREVLPWYRDMWPDSPAEWGFALISAGMGAAIAGSGGGGGGTGSLTDTTATTTTATSSGGGGSSSSGTTTTTTTSTGGGGSSGGGTTTPTPVLEIEQPL